MSADALRTWSDFFVAVAGAAAALTGLLFVAVSISLGRIVASRHLPERALETLSFFGAVLFVALFGLVPGQPMRVLGGEILATGLCAWLAAVRPQLRAQRDPDLEASARRWLWLRALGAQVASVPFIVGGALLLAGDARGIFGVVPGAMGSFIAGAFNAWVLLVEIQR